MSQLINLPNKAITCERGRFGHERAVDVGTVQVVPEVALKPTHAKVSLYPRRGKNPVVISGERNFLIDVLSQTLDSLRRQD